MKQSKLQLLRRYLNLINLQADIQKNMFGANLFYSGAPELIPGLNSGVRVSRFCVVFCRSLFVYLTFRDHCVVWPSINGFLLPLWFLQTLHIPKTCIIRDPIYKQKKIKTNDSILNSLSTQDTYLILLYDFRKCLLIC